MKMSARVQNEVVELAAMNHRLHWATGSNVSEQTKSAQSVCRKWQLAVKDNFKERFLAEFPVGEGLNEKIDLVDLADAIAYELKVSKNNTHFEFYRNIFKVMVHNEHNPRWKIKKLVFITPKKGADRLRTGYGDAVRVIAEHCHAIEVEICGI